MRKIFLLIAVMLVMAGCSTKFDLSEGESTAARLSKGGITYVALPADGDFSGQIHTASGFRVAETLAEVMMPYTNPLVSKTTEDLANALASASHYGCIYLYYATILNWEQRRAAFSGYPSRVKLEISVYEVSSGEMVMQKTLEATGRSMTLRSQKSEELLYYMLSEYIDRFYN